MTGQPTVHDLTDAIWDAFISVFPQEDVIALPSSLRVSAMRRIGEWLMQPGPEITREELLDLRQWAMEEMEAPAIAQKTEVDQPACEYANDNPWGAETADHTANDHMMGAV